MKDVNIRFLEFYNYLIEHKIISSAVDFSSRVDVSTSLITELKKNRTNIGVKLIQNSVKEFGLNANWVLANVGEMFINDKKSDKELINTVIELSAKNALLEQENKELKKVEYSVDNTSSMAAEPKLKKI